MKTNRSKEDLEIRRIKRKSKSVGSTPLIRKIENQEKCLQNYIIEQEEKHELL
jgi:hypothetical protein